MSQPTVSIHPALIKSSLPSWYVYTSADLRDRLRRDMLRGHHLRSLVQQLLSGLQDLTTFARPLLSDALEQHFGFGLDVDRDHFRHVTFADSRLPLPGKLVERHFTVQSLLQAALQNFHQEEVEAATADSVIFQGTPNLANLAAKTSYPHPLKVAPAKFMALCRQLDLGGRYQAHIQAVLEPAASAVASGAPGSAQIKYLLSQQMRNTLYVEAHLAHMQGAERLSSGAYQSILAATRHWAAVKTARAVEIQYLTILGFTLRDVLVFQPRGVSGCVVYVPGDPTAPITEYDSFEQFMRLLRSRLRDADYQQFFTGFIAQRRRAEFICKLRECLTPRRTRPVPGDTGLIPRQWVVAEVDEHADLQLAAENIPYSLLEYFHFQRMLRIKDDARALAVPTGDEDRASRQQRLAHYLESGLDLVNVAALFVPVLGEVMMVVAGSQLLTQTFEGIEAWAHHDMDEALSHLASVAENLATMAAFAAAGKAALPAEIPAIKDSTFIGSMVPVKLDNGQTRLWSPQLTPFGVDAVLPTGLKPSAEGVFSHQGSHYIGIEGRFYRVELDTALNKWRIKPPPGKRFSPKLEHNGAGAWRHEGENPLHWDLKTSFRRLGYSVAALSEQAAEQVMQVTGIDRALLDTLHLENQAPPAALTDAVERLQLNQRVLLMKGEPPASLFERLNRVREASTDPLVQLIKRDFPGMTSAAARELLLETTAGQRKSMNSTQTLPLTITGRARGYLQETRINQALEGFFLESRADHADTLKLALHGLEQLPGWPKDLRIEIHDSAFGGPLLDAIGERSTTRRRILIKQGTGYSLCDTTGHVLAPPDSFYAAVLNALPEGPARSIGITAAAGLRERIIADVASQRRRVAKVLGLEQVAPGFRGPLRLANRRLGYQLSGRGAGAPGWPAGTQELMNLLAALYPEATSLHIHIQNLMFRGWDIPQLLALTRARLQSWEMMRSALEGWVNPTGPGPSISSQQFAVRHSVANALGRAWRFSDPLSPLHSSNLLFEDLNLAGFFDMPDLSAHYREIHYLTLSRVTGDSEDINRLLGRFPAVQRLELMGPGLTQLPEGLVGMRDLTHLSLEGVGLTIDQAAIDLFARIPYLDELDLSRNIIGDITDVSRLRISTLWLNETGLTQWPAWVENLGLRSLDISDNQIVHLPEHILENSMGQPSQLTIHAYDNPIDHEDLRRFWVNDRGYDMTYRLEFNFPEDIRDLVVDTTSSDDDILSGDDLDWHTHHAGHMPYVPPVPVMDIWLIEGRAELNSRLSIAWQQVETANDAPNLLVLLQRLHEAPDFKRFHEELANDVMRVLEFAAADPALRAELEIMANDRLFGADQTCEDGARLIFSDIQVAVYARSELQGVPDARHTEMLFGVIRKLFRLNEVQTIADLEIANREARGVLVDDAEVRMAYRIGLADDLNLPGQPLSMAWSRLASVDRQAILAARRQVLEREAGDEFVNYAVADRRWNERLRTEHQADLTRVTASIRAQMEALEEHPPTDRDEYDRQGRALIASLNAAEKDLLEQLTRNMRQNWF